MNVRAATHDDIEKICGFMGEYAKYQMLLQGFCFDDEVWQKTVRDLIVSQSIVLAEVDGVAVGGIAGRVLPCLFTKDIIVDIFILYVDLEHRCKTAQFLQKFEDIMRAGAGATKMTVAVPCYAGHSKFNRFYRMKGYRQLQSSFMKDLTREVGHGG